MSQKHHKKIRRLVREAEARVKEKKPEIVREAIDEVSTYPFFYRLKLATLFWWQIVRGRRTIMMSNGSSLNFKAAAAKRFAERIRSMENFAKTDTGIPVSKVSRETEEV